jgi:hypothetical protein
MSFGTQLQSCPAVEVSSHFRRFRKIAKTLRISVHPSVCMEQLDSHWTDLNEIWCLMGIFRNCVEKVQI